MSRRERNDPEWQALIAEHQIFKRKLQSKSEALLIISKDLETAQKERDQFKMMAEKLQERCQALKRQQADFAMLSDKAKLIRVLRDTKNQKLGHQRHSEMLQQKLNEALGDIKLLREKFARQRIGDEGIGARHFPLHEREKLVSELEQAQQQGENWHKEYMCQVEVTMEAKQEAEMYRLKGERLNKELSHVLSGDKSRIVDIDALCMENKYLQERISQCQKEKNTLHTQVNKYKSILISKKTGGDESIKLGNLRSAGTVVSPKQLKQMLLKGFNTNSPEQVADLQSIVSALLETINDKNLAMHHLRSTNKILGQRVSELEKKLKTLEVGGLWNVQKHNGKGVDFGNVPIDMDNTVKDFEQPVTDTDVLNNVEAANVSGSFENLSLQDVMPDLCANNNPTVDKTDDNSNCCGHNENNSTSLSEVAENERETCSA
uniref:coiled-coil domain-containing protein 149 isoform X2 n=1 Tax=Ciona intestinalis TaxID=7719 RepID=UPI000180D41F|nr:coiled-coil domain-containing protein 149 isoform X2 [Ciona intestinalis]|eukprot:XP_026691162.1 coiled-coil domain-containing protein 149 isoform X2 [Ciona intestinalis]